jgi:hypothetical protein
MNFTARFLFINLQNGECENFEVMVIFYLKLRSTFSLSKNAMNYYTIDCDLLGN